MDPKAVNYNITIDDFDSILTYSDQALWTSPDPSSFNYTSDGSPWLRGTYHNTTVTGASVTLNFTGPAIYVYGAIGPAYGAYQVVLDNQVTLNGTAFRTTPFTGSHLLFGTSDLTYKNHQIVLRNLGASTANSGKAFLLDYIQSMIQLAPAGQVLLFSHLGCFVCLFGYNFFKNRATVKNVTYEETSSAIRYNGTWRNNTAPFFSGGGTTYTNGNASFDFTFQGTSSPHSPPKKGEETLIDAFSTTGSAIYVLGDKKNNHRGYTVTFDSKTFHYNDTSACGGVFGQTCEEQRPCIKFMASNLAEGNHTLRLLNNPNGPAQTTASFFGAHNFPSKFLKTYAALSDLDSIVVTVPSTYDPRELSNANDPFVYKLNSTDITNGTTTKSGSGTTTHSAAPPMMSNSLLLLVVTVILLLRPWAVPKF